MYHINNSLENFRHALSVQRYNCIYNLLEHLDEITDIDVLLEDINNLTESLPSDMSYTEIKLNLENLILEFSTEYVSKSGIIINTSTTIPFLEALLDFISNLNNYNPLITHEVQNILYNMELDSYLKLGMIVSLYNNDINPLDAYDEVDDIVQGVLDAMLADIENTIEQVENDPSDVYDLINKLATYNSELVTTNVIKYLISYDHMNITEKDILSYIDSLINIGKINSDNLSSELAIYALYFDKDIEEMKELVSTLYNDLGTYKIYTNLETILRGIS